MKTTTGIEDVNDRHREMKAFIAKTIEEKAYKSYKGEMWASGDVVNELTAEKFGVSKRTVNEVRNKMGINEDNHTWVKLKSKEGEGRPISFIRLPDHLKKNF